MTTSAAHARDAEHPHEGTVLDMTSELAPVVAIEGVSKVFQTWGRSDEAATTVAVHDVSLTVGQGEFLSLLGPSGCGKSTLLEIVAGLQRPTEGRVLVGGQEVRSPGPDRAVVFQHYALFPWLTALENVAFPLRLAKVGKAVRQERARDALRTVGLERFAGHYAGQLSGGMQQRVAIARAVICDPKVLLMDEPFSGADAITREVLQGELRDIHRQTGTSILFVTHSVDEALRLSNRIAVLGTHPGRIVRTFEVPETDPEKRMLDRDLELADMKREIWDLLKELISSAGIYQR